MFRSWEIVIAPQGARIWKIGIALEGDFNFEEVISPDPDGA
jgi:hypothetical protein